MKKNLLCHLLLGSLIIFASCANNETQSSDNTSSTTTDTTMTKSGVTSEDWGERDGKKIKTAAGDLESYNATINMLDYHTQQPMTLNCLIHVKECTTQKHTAIYFELSPKPFTHSVWKKLNQIGNSFECRD